MKLLIIGSDRNLFDATSAVSLRLIEQAALVSEMHIVVFTSKEERFKKNKLSKQLTIHPTRSANKLAYLSDAYALGKEILRKDKKNKQWVVTAQDPFEIGVIGYLLSRAFALPLHLQLHTDPFSREWQREHLFNRIRYLLMLFLLHKADGVRVVSERVRRGVSSLGVPEDIITKVPIFVDVDRFMSAIPSFDLHRSYEEYSHIILSMGRLVHEKNYAQLIRAFRKVHLVFPDALLLIVGSGAERERLLALTRSLDLERCVKVLPWARDVVSYYKTCDVYVQPSLYEGWCMAAIEALASSAPIVMTDVGCAGEVVRNEETGIVVPVSSESVLSDAIIRMLKDEALRRTLAAQGQDEAKKLATKAETLALYQSSWEKAFKHGISRHKK